MECTGRYTLKGARTHKPYPSTWLWSVADIIISERTRTWLCPTTIYCGIRDKRTYVRRDVGEREKRDVRREREERRTEREERRT
jgi:hypothetical protein